MHIYLDNSATTAVLPEVIEAMLPCFGDTYGNAQSVHGFGQRAKSLVERARREVAALINAAPGEVVFVAGGTEADNLAIRGVAAHAESAPHIITTQVEHPAVLATCQALEQNGARVTYLPVQGNGVVSVSDVRAAITERTALISVMHANNETGAIQPLEAIAEVVRACRERGQTRLRLHTDAVQSVGKIPVDVKRLGVDLLSLSAHKIHGPKGVGALFVRKGVRLAKQTTGGHHERDRRAGTENVPGIVGLGRAAELARIHLGERGERMRRLRDDFEQQLMARVADVRVNGDVERRVPNVSNLSFAGVDGESLLIALDLQGVAVSTGSACASGSLEPSHVLTAMGLSREQVRGSLRISLSALTTRDEMSYALGAIEETVARLREMRPADAEAVSVESRL
ncbi:MAG TPA: cysteine desulfurase family protein [Blastocatellia bacterium]|nr:cysteine desulfurase family protein [Blastocatellia bacterium]